MFLFIIMIAALIIVGIFSSRERYDSNGFNKDGIHRNGTPYNDSGFNVYGYHKNNRKKTITDLARYEDDEYRIFFR